MGHRGAIQLSLGLDVASFPLFVLSFFTTCYLVGFRGFQLALALGFRPMNESQALVPFVGSLEVTSRTSLNGKWDPSNGGNGS